MLFSYFCFLFTLSYFIVVFLFLLLFSYFIYHVLFCILFIYRIFLLLLGSRPIFFEPKSEPKLVQDRAHTNKPGHRPSDQQPRRKAGPRPAGPLPSRTQQARRAWGQLAFRPSSRTLLLPFSLSRARDSAHDVTWPSFLLLSPPLQACSSLFLNGSHDMAPGLLRQHSFLSLLRSALLFLLLVSRFFHSAQWEQAFNFHKLQARFLFLFLLSRVAHPIFCWFPLPFPCDRPSPWQTGHDFELDFHLLKCEPREGMPNEACQSPFTRNFKL